MKNRCRYCSITWEAEVESRVCDKCKKREVAQKFMIIYDTSDDDCKFTWHGIFNLPDIQGENIPKGCKFKNMRTGEIVEV